MSDTLGFRFLHVGTHVVMLVNILAPSVLAILSLIFRAMAALPGIRSDSLLAGSAPGWLTSADRKGAALAGFAANARPAGRRPNRRATGRRARPPGRPL